MLQQILLQKYYLPFLMITILIASCNSAGTDNSTSANQPIDSNSTEISTAVGNTTVPNTAISGYLDTLWADSSAFTRLPRDKTVFAFTFGQKDTLTMNGWNPIKKNKKDSFPDNPSIYLLKGRVSKISYGPGTYFGNVILEEAAQKKINDLFDSQHAQYVLFAPKKLPSGHIYYEIFLTRENPRLLLKDEKITFAVITTDEEANPSPPKNYTYK